MCLGNERMISRWPARGGPVVFDDTVYYAAGIWPSGGVYLHALDAATGDVVWSNGETGGLLMPQPHGGAEARSGVWRPRGIWWRRKSNCSSRPVGQCRLPLDATMASSSTTCLQENGSIGGSRTFASDRFVINGRLLPRTSHRQTGRPRRARCVQ